MRPHRHFSAYSDDALDLRLVGAWITILLVAGIVVNVFAAALAAGGTP